MTKLKDLQKPRPEVYTKLVIISCDKIPGILEKGRKYPNQLTWSEKMVYEAHTDPNTKLEIKKEIIRRKRKNEII